MRSTDEPLLVVEGLASHYGPIRALSDVSLTVREGELVAIVGANGAGKSTLLRSLSAVQPKSAGTVRFAGDDITRLPSHKVVARGICHAPEGRQVFAPLSVEDNLRLGAYPHRRDRAWLAREIDRVYQLFPILQERRAQPAGTLSGGQQQMLSIGRALLGRPRLLLLDEPSMGLAPLLVEEIFRVVQELNRSGVTVLLVEQNARAALRIAHHGYVLETGRVVMAASAGELLADEAVRKAYLGH
jgi:branched-chain amino acid transport system ATP-binding protein